VALVRASYRPRRRACTPAAVCPAAAVLHRRRPRREWAADLRHRRRQAWAADLHHRRRLQDWAADLRRRHRRQEWAVHHLRRRLLARLARRDRPVRPWAPHNPHKPVFIIESWSKFLILKWIILKKVSFNIFFCRYFGKTRDEAEEEVGCGGTNQKEGRYKF
jgi:hypothetical protein